MYTNKDQLALSGRKFWYLNEIHKGHDFNEDFEFFKERALLRLSRSQPKMTIIKNFGQKL